MGILNMLRKLTQMTRPKNLFNKGLFGQNRFFRSTTPRATPSIVESSSEFLGSSEHIKAEKSDDKHKTLEQPTQLQIEGSTYFEINENGKVKRYKRLSEKAIEECLEKADQAYKNFSAYG